MAAKQKQLSLATINKQYTDEFSKKKKVTLSNDMFIIIDEKFKTTSIQNLIGDFQSILEQLNKENITWDVMKDTTFVYYMLILKHFTSLDNVPIDVRGMVKVCEKLIDLGLLEEIFEHINPKEIEKVTTLMDKVSKNSHLIGDQIGDLFVKAGLSEMGNGSGDSNREIVDDDELKMTEDA